MPETMRDSQLGSITRVAYEPARLRLAHIKHDTSRSRAAAVSRAVQISGAALAVERVGLWMMRDGGRTLECVDQYVLSTGSHTSGPRLQASDYPDYFAALAERRTISAPDARADPATCALTANYFEPNGITSILDAPIIREGCVVGVVCHEHTGALREWTQSEMAFSSTVADMVTIILEQVDRLELQAEAHREAELRASHRKMVALGRLAGSVAHDFNNILTMFAVLAEELAQNVDPTIAQTGKEIADGVALSERLTRQLVLFGRDDASPIQPVRLDELLARIRPLIVGATGSSALVEVSITAVSPEIVADRSLLEQILLNLCINAREAITDAGRVVIRVRDVGPDDEVDDRYLLLEVADDGVGMDEETQDRIFEPYFTTKPHGTGLGLATVYGIIRRLGGLVHVTSAPGQGTTFTVALPRKPAS